MSPENLLIAISVVLVLGIGAQWVAWRFRLPSILLLLVSGFLAGPVTGFIDPASLQGDWLFPFVSLAVGIILFEGGLSLKSDEFREVGNAVRNLITIGVLFTGVAAALGAHYLVGFSWPVSIVLGALLTVTGPTVIIPLLRHVRPSGRVGTIAKWEGITIDPIGAILAVLVLEGVLLLYGPAGAGHGAEGAAGVVGALIKGIFFEAAVGVGMSAIGAGFLILMLRRGLVPDWLQNAFTLMTVVAVFAISNSLQHESGLLSTTLLGIIMANQKMVSVHKIIEFKEDLRVLLISILFIILSARLEPSALNYINTGSLLFLGLLMLVIRPIAVMLSSLGTRLNWKEQAFLAWLAPRGIVAAAVASLFSFRLADIFPEDAAGIVPIVFLVIVGTVAVYGLTISPLARWLGLAQPDPQGAVLIGSHDWARTLGAAIKDAGFKVLMLDANPSNIRAARKLGLTALRTNVLSEGLMDEIDLSGIGRLIALTPNDEVNSLAALHFNEVFESSQLFQLAAGSERTDFGDLPIHLRGRPLFGKGVTYATVDQQFEDGAVIESLKIVDDESLSAFRARYEGGEPLFIVRGDKFHVVSMGAELALQAGDTVIAMLEDASVLAEATAHEEATAVNEPPLA